MLVLSFVDCGIFLLGAFTAMRNWRYINLLMIVGGLFSGYASLSPDSLFKANPDVFACLSVFIGTIIVCVGGVYYSVHSLGIAEIKRPSLDRNAFKFWKDPLQLIGLSFAVSLSSIIGALPRLPSCGEIGLWTFAVDCSITLGLGLGLLLTFRLFKARIIDG